MRRSIRRRGAQTQEEGCSRDEGNHAVCVAKATQWIRSRSSSNHRALLCSFPAGEGVETPNGWLATIHECDEWNVRDIVVDENGRTSIPHVYAGGDIATGAATVIEAMGTAKCAAAAIDAMLKGE